MNKKKIFVFLTSMLFLLLTACASVKPLPDLPEASIARHPEPVDYRKYFPMRSTLPSEVADPSDPFQYDFRSTNLTLVDFSKSIAILNQSDFDSITTWPTADKMPADFLPDQIMELGKDPGLGIRDLHKQGITGLGVGIAIIDQTPLVDHEEYKDRFQIFEDGAGIEDEWLITSMHGPAVTSIAVGKTLGVAPEADLYFLTMGDCNGAFMADSRDFTCLAKDILRIIEINKGLPEGRKIRVISMSIGWSRGNTGYDEIMDAVTKAKEAGIFVISTSLTGTYGFKFSGMARDPMADPNDFGSYYPGAFWAADYYASPQDYEQTIMVPMDNRTTASPNGTSDYVYYARGGWSWVVPYLAGVYAMACQVNPNITPDEFWAAALKTGQTIQLDHEGQQYQFGLILDPKALLKQIKPK